MKKTMFKAICATLSVTMIFASMLLCSSCGKKDFVPEAEGEVYVEPITSAETAKEDPKAAVEEGEYNVRAYRVIAKTLFTRGDKSYNWNEFYNACLSGELNPSGDDAVAYINEIREMFADYELTEQIEEADILLKAVEDAKAAASETAAESVSDTTAAE